MRSVIGRPSMICEGRVGVDKPSRSAVRDGYCRTGEVEDGLKAFCPP